MKRVRWTAGIICCGLAMALACGDADRPLASESGGGTGGYGTLQGPCSPEGTVHECHVRLGGSNDVLQCFVGKQECRGGTWSPCGGTDITLTSIDLNEVGAASSSSSSSSGGGLKFLATPTADGGQCGQDPCDPYCLAYNEDASVPPEAGPPEYYFNSPGSMFGGAPAGFAKKSNCGGDPLGCNGAQPDITGEEYPRKCNGEDHFSTWDSCLADTHCDTTKGGYTIKHHLTATPTTSGGGSGAGAGGYGPTKLNDGDTEATNCNRYNWVNATNTPGGVWLQYDWPSAVRIGSMRVDTKLNTDTCAATGRTLGAATIQYWDGAAWVTHGSVTNQLNDWTYTFATPITTTRLRLYDVYTTGTVGQLNNPVVYEWEVYSPTNYKGECIGNWDTSATTSSQWDEANQRWVPAVCGGVDLTVSAACEVGGVSGFNICNRGNTDAVAANIGLFIDNGNGEFGSSTFAGGACPSKAPSCSPAVPNGVLKPGKCFRVTGANCPAYGTGNGNPVAYVNPQAAIAECGGLLTDGLATAPGCNNNWADVKNGGSACGSAGVTYLSGSKTVNYAAICPPSYRVRWKTLTYAATVPCSPGACNGTNNSKVEFFGALSTPLTDGGTASAPETIIADATTTQTVNCTFGTDAGGQPKCPVDLASWANSVTAEGAHYANLALRILVTPTADTYAAPTVTSWAVSYDCVPYE
jgi:hypothetical protein